MWAELFFFTFMAVPHTDDAPCSAARRPCKYDNSRIEPTSCDEAWFSVFLAIIVPREMRFRKDFFGAEHVQVALPQSPLVLGRVAGDPHGLNVATKKPHVKRDCSVSAA
jgi:hypothetical protein